MNGPGPAQHLNQIVEDFKGTAYRLVRPLADGGMGSVFVAEHVKLARPCVIKLLLPSLSKQPAIIERLAMEGRILGNVEHENLVKVTDLSVTPGGRAFIVMELLTGQTLRSLLAEKRTLPPLEAIELLVQVLRGLGAAHAAQVVHRDVKLDNIFVCAAPNEAGRRLVKVLDFGIAKVLSATLKGEVKFPTSEGMVMGTPLYMSPEQAMAHPVDARSDLYSAGVVLFRVITGEVPFVPPPFFDRDRALVEVFKMHVERQAPLASATAPQPIPADLDACVKRALAKQPSDRFQSAGEFVAALEAVANRIAAQLAAGPARPATDSRTLPMNRTELLPQSARRGHQDLTVSDATTVPLRWTDRVTPRKRQSPIALYAAITLASAAVFMALLLAVAHWARGR